MQPTLGHSLGRALCSSLSSEPAAPPASGAARGWVHSVAVWLREGTEEGMLLLPAPESQTDRRPRSAQRQPLGEKDDKATGGLVNRLGENRSYRLTVPQHRRVIMQQASLSPSSSPVPTCMGLGQGRHQGVLFPMVWEGGGRRIQDGEHMYTHGCFLSMCGKNTTVL